MERHETATRKSSPPLKVYCLPDEKKQIQRQADAAGLSVAAYLRNVGLGYEIHGTLDYRCVEDMARINGDLGRMGGLLKLWLTNHERLTEFRQTDVRKLILGTLAKIDSNQDELRKIIKRVVTS
ncbi:conjugal transfer transcriptional regulator TraJ [Nitrosovibrio sp. Nv4]|uniref:conjugal transfer transcriptional regulator TraJ n=1 Tax=Nitrosovibrio sp. Nv4 TaxID=1945880 RepID=UPI000BCF2C46|nr:conjugal transfer transcriptional regulator TraJ [Nitrosovibrio sp. Nv4]SOD42764.1 hypothetical protein SAMN06298226_3131 [Nitrosovibrio sp. Nv4]